MAKVLISFLGTGPDNKDKGRAERQYRPATYRIEDTDYKDTSFVAEAIASHYKVDKIILIGTTKSMWERVYEVFCTKQGIEINEEYWMELTSFCDNASHKTLLSDFPKKEKLEDAIGKGSKIIPIHYGLNEQELNANAIEILRVENHIHKGDELIVDITHGFRSLPLYIMNLLVYLQNVSSKKLRITNILYGMLDISRELGYTPVVELNGLLKQNDWITGAYSFLEFGNAYKIAKLLREEGGIGLTAAQRLENFSDTMNINYLDSVKLQVANLSSMKNFEFSPIPNVIIPNTISSYLKTFNITMGDSFFQYTIAQWHFNHKNYASSYMVLTEALFTYVCEMCEIATDSPMQDAELAKIILGKRDVNNHISRSEIVSYQKKNLKYSYEKLKKIYNSINKIRNSIAHQTKHFTTKSTSKLIDNLREGLNLFADIYQQDKLSPIKSYLGKPNMLINISNHPSDKWSEAQTSAAISQFGEIVDLPFPTIEPNATPEDITKIAQDYLNRVHQKGKPKTTAIHIMGEMTLTYQLVGMLKDAGYRCYASTTIREVYEQEPGKKTVIFQFVNFREY